MSKGLTHIYYGYGKGKTTAAFGLALRAHGSGKRVTVLQFLKSAPTSELAPCEALGIHILRGHGCCQFSNTMTEAQLAEARACHDRNFAEALELVRRGECDLLILDEVLDAAALKLLRVEPLLALLQNKPDSLELVLTGHKPDLRFWPYADYITEMRAERHPYEKGVPARKGIEF